VLQGGSNHSERDVGIYARACSVMNEQYRACVTWGALKCVQASGDRCGSCLATGNNGDDSSRDPWKRCVVGHTILRGDHNDAPNASGCRERLQRPAQCRLSSDGDE
jgi:hypothetical protein